MSRSRTPENFPRMKVRGGRRRQDAAVVTAWRGIDWASITLGISVAVQQAQQALDGIARAAQSASALVGAWLRKAAFQESWRRDRAHDQWAATHALTTGRTQ